MKFPWRDISSPSTYSVVLPTVLPVRCALSLCWHACGPTATHQPNCQLQIAHMEGKRRDRETGEQGREPVATEGSPAASDALADTARRPTLLPTTPGAARAAAR